MSKYDLGFEPPLEPPEPRVAFVCDDCGGDIYVCEDYYEVQGIRLCVCCMKEHRKEAGYETV